MSKIRIKGDTSGYVDLETSATGSNLSIGGNTTVTGTAAITGPATISGPNNYEGLIVENTATDFAGGYMKIRDGNSTAGQYTWIGRNSNITYVQSSNSKVAMQFTNDGVVTKPEQPSFRAGMSGGQTLGHAAATKINFNTVYSQYGSSYNNTNYRFTCPVDGRYLFTWHVYMYNCNNSEVKLYKNNSSIIRIAFPLTSANVNPHGSGGSTIVEASANDYFEIWGVGYRSDSGNFLVYSGSGSESASHFSGMLLG